MIRRTLPLTVAALVTVSSVAGAAPEPAKPEAASAATPEAVAEARTRYLRGTQLYADGDYRLAAIEFQRSYDLTHNFQALYNLGQVHYQLNNYAKAAQTLSRYLADGGSQVPAARRSQVEADLKWLYARTAQVTILTTVDGADVTVDDIAVGRSPVKALLIDAGEHRVGASQSGRERASQTVVCAGGDNVNVNLDMPAIQGARVDTVAPKHNSYVWVGWVAAGTLAAGAVTTGLVTLFKYADYRDEKNSPASVDDPDGTVKRAAIEQKSSRVNTYGVATAIVGGAAVVTAGVSLYFTIRESSTPSSTLRVTLNPGGIALGGAF